MIFGDLIGRWGRAEPEREALVDADSGRRLTYGALAGESEAMAAFLSRELGVSKGDRVACLSYNRAEYVSLFFAVARLGAILVPLNYRLAPAELGYYLDDARPGVLVCDGEHAELAASIPAAEPPRRVRFDDLPGGRAGRDAGRLPEVELGPGDPALIIYTSGTTGLPKGVVLTHGMLAWNAFNTVLGWDLRAGDRTILHAGMFYTAGWNVFTLPLFQCRGANVVVRSFEPELVLDLIARERVTVFFGVPTMYAMLAESPRFESADLGSVRFAVSGGAPLGADLRERYARAKGVRIWEGYGLTEVGPNNFLANGKPGTLGHPMPFVDVKLVDGGGRTVAPGEDGEVLLRGPHVCAGYWNQPAVTAEAIVEGWFHTGDIGRTDEDGHFAIVGRKKDMFISGGANVYPAELERLIERHPAVAAAVVIGVPDEKWGEVGKAVVELRPGARLGLAELRDFLGAHVGRFKLPRYLAVLDELPRTQASGKVQRFVVRERHGGADDR